MTKLCNTNKITIPDDRPGQSSLKDAPPWSLIQILTAAQLQ